jgi:hypothetical protein
MPTLATLSPSARSLRFTVDIRHDPILGAHVVLRLEPTVFVEPVHTLSELSAYFARMADWQEWQPTVELVEARGVVVETLEASVG